MGNCVRRRPQSAGVRGNFLGPFRNFRQASEKLARAVAAGLAVVAAILAPSAVAEADPTLPPVSDTPSKAHGCGPTTRFRSGTGVPSDDLDGSFEPSMAPIPQSRRSNGLMLPA
jgi:hypothetical protein